jgi:hypothetical protein
MLNLRRITLVRAVPMLFGLAALVNAVPPTPNVMMSTDSSAWSYVHVAALAAATVAYCRIGTEEGVVRNIVRNCLLGERCIWSTVEDVAPER